MKEKDMVLDEEENFSGLSLLKTPFLCFHQSLGQEVWERLLLGKDRCHSVNGRWHGKPYSRETRDKTVLDDLWPM